MSYVNYGRLTQAGDVREGCAVGSVDSCWTGSGVAADVLRARATILTLRKLVAILTYKSPIEELHGSLYNTMT